MNIPYELRVFILQSFPTTQYGGDEVLLVKAMTIASVRWSSLLRQAARHRRPASRNRDPTSSLPLFPSPLLISTSQVSAFHPSETGYQQFVRAKLDSAFLSSAYMA